MRPALEPLRCPSCGGLAPLGDEAQTRCPYCRSAITIPSEYLALRAVDRAHGAGKKRAERLYARLGQPPGRALRFWARAGTFVLWGMLILSPASLLLWLVVISQAWHLAPYLGFQPVDVLGGVPLSLLLGSSLLALVVWPVLRVKAARDLARTRHMLQAALAARPPERPSGPATCRNCGAPLDVPANALGARCLYCREHNLLAIPRGWIDRARAAHTKLGLHLAEASAEERTRRRQLGRRSRRAFGTWALILFVLSLASAVLSSGPSYRDYARRSLPELYAKNMYQAALVHGQEATLQFEACRTECCGIEYMAALERGQTSRFLSSAADSDLPNVNYYPAYVAAPGYAAPFSAANPKQSLFRAPWSGWFTVRFELSGACSRPRAWKVRWERDAAPP